MRFTENITGYIESFLTQNQYSYAIHDPFIYIGILVKYLIDNMTVYATKLSPKYFDQHDNLQTIILSVVIR